MLPSESPSPLVPSFSHFNASERRHVALRSRYVFAAIILFAAVSVIASVVNYGSNFLLSHDTQYAARASRPTLASIVTPQHFNVARATSPPEATAVPRPQPAASVAAPIAKIIMALGAAEIASLVRGSGEVLSPHSAKLQASKITGAIILE